MVRRLSQLGFIGFLGLRLAGCASSQEGNDMLAGTDESALDLGVVTSALTAIDAPIPAAMVQAMLATREENACKTRTVDANDPNVVHVQLRGCTGRFGRHTIDGEVVITFSKNDDGTLRADHQSVGLTVDGNDATRTGRADISFNGDARHVVWHGTRSGTNDRGEAISAVADHTIDVSKATGCSVLNGTSTVTRAGHVVSSTLDAITSCVLPDGAHGCPTGEVRSTVEGHDMSITKTFDGSATAIITITKPKHSVTRDVAMNCVPHTP